MHLSQGTGTYHTNPQVLNTKWMDYFYFPTADKHTLQSINGKVPLNLRVCDAS